MHHRRRRLAVGMIVAALVIAGAASIGPDGPRTAAAGAQSTPASTLGSVTSDGGLRTSERGWQAARLDVGSYRLELTAGSTFALRSWTSVASVTAKPISPTAWTVTFTAPGGEPVDSAFTFTASPAG